tara:strand:- start:733 stop:1266 length:534 start_codon:yes stop_codon:yes gene_type:complete
MINFVFAFVVIKLIYKSENSENDFVFSYFMFNSLIFFFAFLLSDIQINIGFGFGLFAIFAILRYRTDPIPIKEMTYLFIVITLGALNAIVGASMSYVVVLTINLILVTLTYFCEKYWQNNLLLSMNINYENIENIRPDKHEILLQELKERTGIDILHFEIRRVNFLRDTARIRIYYK